MKDSLESLTLSELRELENEVAEQIRRREVLESAQDRLIQVEQEILAAEQVEQGEPWRPLVLGYPKGWRVTHQGEWWVSNLDRNTWEPGSAGGGWRLEPPEDGTPARFVKPAHVLDGYEYGALVTFPDYETGQVYRSIFDGPNVWSPAEYPDAWEVVEPEPLTPPTPRLPRSRRTQSRKIQSRKIQNRRTPSRSTRSR